MKRAYQNSYWISRVRNLLVCGLGVEDIAIRTNSPLECVQNEVKILRAKGDLERMFGGE